MKIIKYSLLFSTLISVSCCVNQKQKDEEQIKNTIKEYWKAVKRDDVKKCMDLIFESDEFEGGVHSDLFFLHKNYNKINPNDILLENIKIKDTVVMFAENKQKYVQYVIKKENDTTYLKKPLIITFMFYKPIGYNKIFNGAILRNSAGWDK